MAALVSPHPPKPCFSAPARVGYNWSVEPWEVQMQFFPICHTEVLRTICNGSIDLKSPKSATHGVVDWKKSIDPNPILKSRTADAVRSESLEVIYLKKHSEEKHEVNLSEFEDCALESIQAPVVKENEPSLLDMNIKLGEAKSRCKILEAELLKLKTRLEVYEEFREWVEEGTSKAFIELDSSVVDDVVNGKSPFAKGGFGVVYRVCLDNLDVALKVPRILGSMEEHAAFCKEAEILKNIRHPCLVTLLGACTERCVLAYEYLPGGTLEDKLLAGQAENFSWRLRVMVAYDMCSALIFLHSTKPVSIAHGDLKPSNVLFGSNGRAKLSDFGISRHLQNNTDSGTPSHLTDNPKGSGCYMDPCFKSTRVITHQADTFAYGIILLELVSGLGAQGLRNYACDKVNSIRNFNKEKQEKFLCKVKLAATQWDVDSDSRAVALAMVHLGIRCSSTLRQDRPSLEVEVWPCVQAWHQMVLRH